MGGGALIYSTVPDPKMSKRMIKTIFFLTQRESTVSQHQEKSTISNIHRYQLKSHITSIGMLKKK